jgi:hypothetical protein
VLHGRVDGVARAFQFLERFDVAAGRLQRVLGGLLRQHLDLRGQRDGLAVFAVLLEQQEEVHAGKTDRQQQQNDQAGIATFPAYAPWSTHLRHLARLVAPVLAIASAGMEPRNGLYSFKSSTSTSRASPQAAA